MNIKKWIRRWVDRWYFGEHISVSGVLPKVITGDMETELESITFEANGMMELGFRTIKASRSRILRTWYLDCGGKKIFTKWYTYEGKRRPIELMHGDTLHHTATLNLQKAESVE